MLWFLALLACPAPTDTSDKPDDTAGDTGSDLDSDGDGVPDTADCEPENNNVYPGHSEIPYNGVDDDCDGVDLTDVDGDGFDGDSLEGGTDCDDSNPTINPGVAEVCYNLLDDNCDGLEGGNDCDSDGYPLGSDCDDENADANPGMSEIWYDGVDADCDGHNDYDQDYDEMLSVDHGGDDCDDTNPNVNPDTSESWNGTDDDCNGVSDDLSTQESTNEVNGDSGAGELLFGGSLVVLPDLDGDGRRDLAIGAGESSEYVGWVWVVPMEDGVVTPKSEALSYITGTGGTGTAMVLTSVTGSEQVAVGSPWGTDGGSVAFYDADAMGDGLATATMTQSGAGGTMTALGDGQLLVGCTYGSVTTSLSVWSSVSGDVEMTDAPFSLYDESVYCNDTASLGDLDGDGADELIVASVDTSLTTYQAWLIDSALQARGGSVTVRPLQELADYESSMKFGTLRDIDGNGYDEAMITISAADATAGDDGRIWIVDGSAFTTITDRDATAMSTVSGGVEAASLRPGNVGDPDHDGNLDLMLGAPGIGTIGWVALADLTSGGDHLLAEGNATFSTGSLDDLFGDNLWAEDIDSDGNDDLLVRQGRVPGSIGMFLYLP